MIKKVLVLFFVFFIVNIVLGQNEQDYLGAIKLSDSTLITYKLVFNKNLDNTIEGYSLTDIGGEHETKSTIVGKYDEQSKILSFRENSIIYTKSPVSELDFCFVHFYSNSFRYDKSKNLSGIFAGKFSDNTECINGEIRLQKTEKIVKKFNKLGKKIEKSKIIHDSIKNKINPTKVMDSLNMNILRKKETMSVFSNKDSLQLILYDGGQEDGDKVSIFVDGKQVLYNYLISNKKEILNIPLLTNKTKIVVRAESVGSISTNTAVLEIDDSNNNIRALTNLKKGEETTIDVLKVK